MTDLKTFAASTLELLQQDPRRYVNFGPYWYLVKAVLKKFYTRDNLHLLGDHVDADVVARMAALGCDEIDIADTIGVSTPRKTQAVLHAAGHAFPIAQLAGHFHDTYGQALVNTLAALQMGVWNFQSSVAGLGGCPYAKGATGNVATEDVVYMMQGMGIETGIDLDKLIDAGVFISEALGRKPNSLVSRAVLNKRGA